MDMDIKKTNLILVVILLSIISESKEIENLISNNEIKLSHNFFEHNNESGSAVVKKSREKRFIFLNIDGSLDVGFLLTIPFTIVLPPMSNLFNAWRYKKRSKRDAVMMEDEENLIQFEDPVLQPIIDQIKVLFELIQIPESNCQLRAICEFSSDPDKYFPLSELILPKLQDLPLLTYSATITNHTSTFELYKQASELGLTQGHETCESTYKFKCPFSSEQRLNLPLLQFWKMLGSLLGVKFHNEGASNQAI